MYIFELANVAAMDSVDSVDRSISLDTLKSKGPNKTEGEVLFDRERSPIAHCSRRAQVS